MTMSSTLGYHGRGVREEGAETHGRGSWKGVWVDGHLHWLGGGIGRSYRGRDVRSTSILRAGGNTYGARRNACRPIEHAGPTSHSDPIRSPRSPHSIHCRCPPTAPPRGLWFELVMLCSWIMNRQRLIGRGAFASYV